MTEYECLFAIRIHADDGTAKGETLVVLPFAPFAGLYIDGIRPDMDPAVVESVLWDTVKQCFMVDLEADTCQNSDPAGEPVTLAELKDEYGGDWTWKDSDDSVWASKDEAEPV